MRFATLSTLTFVLYSCGVTAENPASSQTSKVSQLSTQCSARELPKSENTQIGIAHVAGRYTPVGMKSNSFLLSGAQAISNLGSRAIKVYLTSEFREKYPESWPQNIHTLVELAKTEQFKTLFAMPFETFVITTYAFSTGTSHAWREKEDSALLASERTEIEELTRFLLRTYSGSGKTFILQNWEGDWALLNNYNTQAAVEPARLQRMTQWLNMRQEAVSSARDQVGENNVFVRNAVELNRVLDATDDSVQRVVTKVLPHVCADAVSYSVWEALEINSKLGVNENAKRIESRLTAAIDTIRANMTNTASLYFGEVGFAESELAIAPADMKPLLNAVNTVASAKNVTHSIYWQVFDNECQGSGESLKCRGFWVMKPDGELSGAGRALETLLKG